ncbi:hypothetical protein ACVWZN_001561 [Lysobacter sp. HA35]
MADPISELGVLDPWLWRGWAYALSPTYRARTHRRWQAHSRLYVAADIALSLAVVAAEIALVAWVFGYGLGMSHVHA